MTKSLSPDKTSQDDSGEPLAEQLMNYRSWKRKKKNHWSQTFILFPSWVVFWLWLDAHNLMRGLPPVMWVYLQAWDCLCMIYQLYVATSAKIISFETNCCKLQNPAPIVHLVQTWIHRVPGSLPLIPWLKFMRKEELFGFSVLSRGCL